MAIKLDKKKSYDRLEWHFLKTCLSNLGFSHKWINWVMERITSTTFSVLVNGILGKFFKPSRGIRLGDPISPYLFIICAKYLGRYIFHKASFPKIGLGIKVTTWGPTIPFLMFADDCIILSKASKNATRNIKEVLEEYCKVSGQLVNYHKSSIYFSKNSDRSTRATITDILQIPQSKRLDSI